MTVLTLSLSIIRGYLHIKEYIVMDILKTNDTNSSTHASRLNVIRENYGIKKMIVKYKNFDVDVSKYVGKVNKNRKRRLGNVYIAEIDGYLQRKHIKDRILLKKVLIAARHMITVG